MNRQSIDRNWFILAGVAGISLVDVFVGQPGYVQVRFSVG